MKQFMLFPLMLLTLLTMAACGGGGETLSPTEQPPTEPLDVDVSALEDSMFLINFSGKYVFSLSGEALINPMASGVTQIIMGDDTLSDTDDIPDASSILINIPEGWDAGNYPLESSIPGQQADGITLMYTNLEDSNSGEMMGTVLSGQISLTSVSPFTGAFEAVLEAGTEGEVLRISGAFRSVASRE